ncbi:MAG TPA: hypothetical protein VM600_02530 [Actinomycetota bacterium]|nr:hypothetical protein [Actinomycetota bacterium]
MTDEERERDDYFAGLADEQSLIDKYTGALHPASVRGGRKRPPGTTAGDVIRAAGFVVATFVAVFVAIGFAMGDRDRLLETAWTMLMIIPAAAIPVVLILAVIRVMRRR